MSQVQVKSFRHLDKKRWSKPHSNSPHRLCSLRVYVCVFLSVCRLETHRYTWQLHWIIRRQYVCCWRREQTAASATMWAPAASLYIINAQKCLCTNFAFFIFFKSSQISVVLPISFLKSSTLSCLLPTAVWYIRHHYRLVEAVHRCF